MLLVRSSTITSLLGHKMVSNSSIRRLAAITLIIGGLSIFMLTAIIYASVNYWLPRQLDIEDAGVPYAYAALLCGLTSSFASFYSAYLLFSTWDSRKFLSLVQILLGILSSSVVVSSILFIIKTNIFGLEGAVCVTIAIFISLPLILIIQLIKNDLHASD